MEKSINERFLDLGEYLAAGLFENEDTSYFERYSRGWRRYLENYRLPEYNGEPIFPVGAISRTLVKQSYAFTVEVESKALYEADATCAQELDKLLKLFAMKVPGRHTIGGCMYTHAHPNFKRILHEGLNSYEERIKKLPDSEVRRGLLDLMTGIRTLHKNILDYLGNFPEAKALCDALRVVPFEPATTLYEGLVCYNFIYYLDGCDNIGKLDADLYYLYRGEDVTKILECFFKNVDDNNGWSGTLGPKYNELTMQCLEAVKGKRRPSLELLVTKDMPKEVWEKATEAIYAGGGSPSLYNDDGYREALRLFFPELPDEEAERFSGGGCTETMLAGISNVGSLDAGINVAWIFEQVMRQKLTSSVDFDSFYQSFISVYENEVLWVLDGINESQKSRAEFRPQPMRTLLIDDCIDKGRDFNNFGARHYWSIVNLAGTINVLDSLLVIKSLVYGGKMTADEFLAKLDAGESFLGYKDIPRHGQNDEGVKKFLAKLMLDLCRVFDKKTPYLGGKFMASSIQFMTYVYAGARVGATPDGRVAGAPLCDSINAIHGNDKGTVTSALLSACAFDQRYFAGTPVLNMKLNPKQVGDKLPALVNSYFASGGLQMQITCASAEDMIDAMEHPERHPELVVRIGGYSEYFNRLSRTLQQTVIDRTLHEG